MNILVSPPMLTVLVLPLPAILVAAFRGEWRDVVATACIGWVFAFGLTIYWLLCGTFLIAFFGRRPNGAWDAKRVIASSMVGSLIAGALLGTLLGSMFSHSPSGGFIWSALSFGGIMAYVGLVGGIMLLLDEPFKSHVGKA